MRRKSMKRLIVVACWLSIFGVGWCFGQTQYRNDGNRWHVLPPVAHTFYVKGFTDGYASAMLHGVALAIATNAPEKVSSMKPAEIKNYEENLRWAKKIVPLESKPIKEFEGALDTFYSDYRNVPVCLDEAMLFSLASITGNAATDQELDAARKKGAENR